MQAEETGRGIVGKGTSVARSHHRRNVAGRSFGNSTMATVPVPGVEMGEMDEGHQDVDEEDSGQQAGQGPDVKKQGRVSF